MRQEPVSSGVVATLPAKMAAAKLLGYCRAHDWAGYDPYDALNSRWFQILPFVNSRLPRLAATQLLKRSPINFRRALLVPKTQNAKALALFLASFLRLPTEDSGDESLADREALIGLMVERLSALRSPGVDYWCWGYSFPWQGRANLVPKGAANLVCTTFVADALLDAWEQRQDSPCLSMAVGAAEYILNDLYWSEGSSTAGFSYPLPGARSQVHNANFLAAALLCRVAAHTGERKFLAPAMQVARCSASRQNLDGSWFYGEELSQRWIDNFHTGYSLCALQSIAKSTETGEFDAAIRRGFEFYRTHFFHADGAAKYFHNRTYPIDMHSIAQSIITLLAFQDSDSGNVALAASVLDWALAHMWDDRGFFYYRVYRFMKVRTSYMRWSQAWMLLALATFLRDSAGCERLQLRPIAALVEA